MSRNSTEVTIALENYYSNYIHDIASGLKNIKVTDNTGLEIDREQGIAIWGNWTHEVEKSKKQIYFIGNGASAAMAAHMSADATKNGKLRCMNFNDSSLITAISNDIDYHHCFSLPIQRFGDPGDLLITISSSGNSQNIVSALKTAKKMRIKCVTLSGMEADNDSRSLGELNFYIPTERYGSTECGHQIILHCWLDYYMENYLNERI